MIIHGYGKKLCIKHDVLCRVPYREKGCVSAVSHNNSLSIRIRRWDISNRHIVTGRDDAVVVVCNAGEFRGACGITAWLEVCRYVSSEKSIGELYEKCLKNSVYYET